jgi:hypothetical protein
LALAAISFISARRFAMGTRAAISADGVLHERASGGW